MHVSPLLDTLNRIFLNCIRFSRRLLNNIHSDSKSKSEIVMEHAPHTYSCVLLMLNIINAYPNTHFEYRFLLKEA